MKDNTVVGIFDGPGTGIGIDPTGIVTGNYAIDNRFIGIRAGQGSTVIGNTALNDLFNDNGGGLVVDCPSNVTDNTAVNNSRNLVLNGTGCNNTDNVVRYGMAN